VLLKNPTKKENPTTINNRGPEKARTVLPVLHRVFECTTWKQNS